MAKTLDPLLTSSLSINPLAMENMGTMAYKLPSPIPMNPTNTLQMNPTPKIINDSSN